MFPLAFRRDAVQKYWHKGAFFQGDGGDGEDVLGDVMHRSYDAPTGEDKFDKQMLPKIMQVCLTARKSIFSAAMDVWRCPCAVVLKDGVH